VTTHIAAPPEVVWPYLTEPARYALWMGTEVTLSPIPGGLYRVHMREGIEARGEFVELDPPHRLVFTWGWQDHPVVPPGSTTVEITLQADEVEKYLTVVEECAKSWLAISNGRP
jgi:uncharacterized protein YndB with AHSA1/START domain